MLPVVFATPVARFNPDRGIDPLASTPPCIIADVLRGAWAAPVPNASRVLH
jgi:hypothetical protein